MWSFHTGEIPPNAPEVCEKTIAVEPVRPFCIMFNSEESVRHLQKLSGQ